MRYLPPVRTKLAPKQVAELFRDAWKAVVGAAPSAQTLTLLMAKSGLETAEWATMWNFNFGNVKALGKYRGDYTCILVSEVLKGKEVWFRPEGELSKKGGELVGQRYEVPSTVTEGEFGHPQTRMRAYPTAEEGARRYVLAMQLNFPKSFASAARGDSPANFVRTLAEERYFTASIPLYIKGTEWRCGLYARVAQDAVSSEPRMGPELRLGDKLPAVGEWQELALGWTKRPLRDNDFGPKTEAATREWQRARGLPDTGVVDSTCWVIATREKNGGVS